MTDAEFMRMAIQAGWEGLHSGEMPFGACIVRGAGGDGGAQPLQGQCRATSHAKVQPIREASRTLKTIELPGCVIYATCEP